MNLDILTYYEAIESTINLDEDIKYKSLVHPSDTQQSNVHNWYKFKEGYSPNLLNEILEYFSINKNVRLLDPFCGSGTTILSSILLDTDIHVELATGIEVNPFIHFVADTKVKFSTLNTSASKLFIKNLESIDIFNYTTELNIPELSTIPKAFSHKTLIQLLNLRELIKNTFSDSYEANFFKLALASILEQVSCMRKSGRALKIVRELVDYDVKQIFIEKCCKMIEECEVLQSSHSPHTVSKAQIVNIDIRELQPYDVFEGYNLVVFSPPYLNHFDYTEVYKIELWMLEFVSNKEEFRNLRYRTFRSHPSIKFEKTDIYKSYHSKIINDLITYLESLEKKEQFYTTILGYIDDMYKTLSKLHSITSNDASLACIVANSLFGSKKKDNLTPVATDLIISEIAKDIGFEIVSIKVARELTRRGIAFPYGRESIIYFKKVSSSN
ncbi:hypothetical protein [Paenibacillus arenosi]|uniref:DNA methylase N-4/N-6 domain-containing protein n=1 Tax=Paenibacillus arenosi TaxID=2774142 RepID=A0ABR9AZ80_9BACL|nr:hypothetical protein [Paenibacillus arenosi]MBD8498517.1 hypothetical protein [Paenibacillus arenosi]